MNRRVSTAETLRCALIDGAGTAALDEASHARAISCMLLVERQTKAPEVALRAEGRNRIVKIDDHDLSLRLHSFEDAFVERKTSGDSKDWLKTVVAFANSTPVDYPAVMFIGVKEDGTPEDKQVNLDSLQRTLSEQLAKAYPPIYYLPHVLDVNGKQVLAIIVPGSSERPHFAGQSYTRDGSKTVQASKDQFDRLIATRNSKSYLILQWKDKTVLMGNIRRGEPRPSSFGSAVIADCNQFWVTLKIGNGLFALPLERTELSFDHNQKTLVLIEHPA